MEAGASGEKVNYEELRNKKKRQKHFNPKEDDLKIFLKGMKKIYEKDFSRVNPWVVTVGQLDEDEDIEIFVGAYRKTYYYPDNTRPYFFVFRDGNLLRQWTGSYLDNLTFSDADFTDENLDGISTLKLKETVLKKGSLKDQEGEFTIKDFNPIRLGPNVNELGGINKITKEK